MPVKKKAVKRTPNINFMKAFVEDFIEGRSSRLDFDLDFSYHVINRYDKMYRENRDFAEAFAFYVSEQGFDIGERLPEDEYIQLISEQYQILLDAERDGFF